MAGWATGMPEPVVPTFATPSLGRWGSDWHRRKLTSNWPLSSVAFATAASVYGWAAACAFSMYGRAALSACSRYCRQSGLLLQADPAIRSIAIAACYPAVLPTPPTHRLGHLLRLAQNTALSRDNWLGPIMRSHRRNGTRRGIGRRQARVQSSTTRISSGRVNSRASARPRSRRGRGDLGGWDCARVVESREISVDACHCGW